MSSGHERLTSRSNCDFERGVLVRIRMSAMISNLDLLVMDGEMVFKWLRLWFEKVASSVCVERVLVVI